MATVTIKTVPVTGKISSQDVEVKETGTSLKDVLAAANISLSGMQVTINGEPVDVHRPHLVHVPAGATATVTLTERVRGS